MLPIRFSQVHYQEAIYTVAPINGWITPHIWFPGANKEETHHIEDIQESAWY